MRFWSRTSPGSGAEWHAQEIDWRATTVAVTAGKNDDTLTPGTPGGLLQSPELVEAKVRLHRKLIDELNLSHIEKIPRTQLRHQVHAMISDYVASERLPLNTSELNHFVDEVMDELIGLGPIEPILRDPSVTDILINTHERVYVERGGLLERVPVRFKDEAHVLRIVNKIVGAVGRRVDESSPMVDARLVDGSRINVAVRPIAIDGPLVSIRKFAKRALQMDSLLENGTLSVAMARVLGHAVRSRLSILISGGTGSGKTTFLNALSGFIAQQERLITIEDAAELQLQQPHVGRLETRPPNIEGRGEIRQRELVKNALRMRPDRIIVGEVRGEEAFDMLQAMTTGHEGSMTTVHANSPRDAIARLEQMVGMAGFPMTENSIRSQIASAIKIVVQLHRFADGKRRVTSVSEVVGLNDGAIALQEIFKLVRAKPGTQGTLFQATGVRPSFLETLELNGATFPEDTFRPGAAL
jgi:pilus assembly protein CpaF